MGVRLRQRDFYACYQGVQQGLFILLDRRLVPENCTPLNIGLHLGEALVAIGRAERADRVTDLLKGLISTLDRTLLLENIDILFDPSYGNDVIKQLLYVGRNRRLLVLWPGSLDGGKLVYGEEGYQDHRQFDLDQYVDTYVVTK